jgi:hypothetical protein
MVRKHLQAGLQRLGTPAQVVALVLLVVLVDGGPAVATHGATSMRIISWEYIPQGCTVPTGAGSCAPPPNIFKQVFDKTITDMGLVREIQTRLDASPPTTYRHDCPCAFYSYEFRFATLGVTTQVYDGSALSPFTVTTLGIPSVGLAVDSTTLDGVDMLDALHNLTGMPIGAPPT